MSRKKVVIIGGGIGGLSAAFDLMQAGGFDVHLYERNHVCGGQARSIESPRCSNVYAWRVWTSSYYNFFDIVDRIPSSSSGQFVGTSNFVELPKYVHSAGRFSDNNRTTLDIRNFQSKSEFRRVIRKLAAMMSLSDAGLKRYCEVTFYDYIDPREQATVDFVDEFVGPILGMEARKATMRSVVRGWNLTYFSLGIYTGFRKPRIYVTTKPYNDAIFTPWVRMLRNGGVQVHMDTPIQSIDYDPASNRVRSVHVGNAKIVRADEFVLALDQTALRRLLMQSTSELMSFPMIQRASELCKVGNQMYFGFMLYFSEEFDSASLPGACASDQPWKPVIQNYRTVWDLQSRKKCDAAELLQVSCLNLVPGYNGKTLEECSVQEALEESLLQLRRSILMRDMRTASGKSVWDVVDGYEVWPHWKTSSRTGRMYNKLREYKFSINRGVWRRMPTTTTPISNLFFGSVIAKTDTPMVSMEIACTAGRNAAHAIASKHQRPHVPRVIGHPGWLPVILAPWRALNSIWSYLFPPGCPNPP